MSVNLAHGINAANAGTRIGALIIVASEIGGAFGVNATFRSTVGRRS